MAATRSYLDHNATSPLRPEAIAAIQDGFALTGNPSSVHGAGRAVRARMEAARRTLAALVDGRPGDLVFTSGATEANALALASLTANRPGPLLVSAIEHDSILAQAGPTAERIPVTAAGLVDLEWLEARLARDPLPAAVSVMAVNNETGIIQPVAEVARLASGAGVPIHCDAVQALGKRPVDLTALGITSLTLSAHKLGGPAGIGAVVQRPGRPWLALLKGGGHERSRRAGTENLLGILGFAAAAQAAVADMDTLAPRLAAWRDGIEAAAGPGALLAGRPRVANTATLAHPGLPAETLVMKLDLAGCAVSAGSACSSGKVRSSHVLTAMGLPPDIAGSAVRVSLGWSTTQAEVDQFIDAWRRITS